MNLARFLAERAAIRPDLRFGLVNDPVRLDEAVTAARKAANVLGEAGFEPGSRIAVIDATSTDYIVFWMACQFAGVEPALINPTYPDELVTQMLERLRPAAVAAGGPPRELPAPTGIDFSGVRRGVLRVAGTEVTGGGGDPPGLDRDELAICGSMHTSGTTGLPKFCAQSHRYFLRVGRFVAEQLAICPDDRVLAPLPLFHINPFGYGFLGALSGLADHLTLERFSASGFWPAVKDNDVTVLVLHSPPVEILKRRTGWDDARGHRVRAMFYTDLEFLDRYRVPLGVSGYGSTEAGGLCHAWQWRRGDTSDVTEGVGRFAGWGRRDIDWRLTSDGEIQVRGAEPGVLFSGYLEPEGLRSAVDDDGWYSTGDNGRDDAGRLVFIERRAESIRVKGEFVPIDHVEAVFAAVDGVEDVALWKRPSELTDDEPVLYVAASEVPVPQLRAAARVLAKFMRPVEILHVAEIPRDRAAGKVQRRRLPDMEVLETWQF
jgi:crotonobetaine/carnitine-CoA ligase